MSDSKERCGICHALAESMCIYRSGVLVLYDSAGEVLLVFSYFCDGSSADVLLGEKTQLSC